MFRIFSLIFSLFALQLNNSKQTKLRHIFKHKWVKIPTYLIIISFALIGVFLTASYVAIQLRLTDQKGSVDSNNRYFQEMKDQYNQSFKLDTSKIEIYKYEALNRILTLNKFYPKNAQYILAVMQQGTDIREILKMLDAVDINLQSNAQYMSEIQKIKSNQSTTDSTNHLSVFEWMNIAEWADFKIAVAKDKKLIDSVAKQTNVEERLIVACLVGEQIRLFNSDREAYKRWIGPLKILSVESKFSLGVTGIKELTAKNIEAYLKDSTSKFYLGKQYEHLLDFKTENIDQERFDRLTTFKNHYYSYMYAAVFLKQVKLQWERAGFPITDRPEILATLFNVGFPQSQPKSNPRVGGSTITVHEQKYSFGALAYQFYYSGELNEIFPIRNKKFDWH